MKLIPRTINNPVQNNVKWWCVWVVFGFLKSSFEATVLSNRPWYRST